MNPPGICSARNCIAASASRQTPGLTPCREWIAQHLSARGVRGPLYLHRSLDQRDPGETTGQQPFGEPLRVGWELGLDPVCTAGLESAPGAFRVDGLSLHFKPFI